MTKFFHNDAEYIVEPSGYDICRLMPDGSSTFIGTNLFPGVPASEAETRSLALIKTVCPIGIKVVGPDVSHPNKIGDLKIVGPDITHPNFVYWDKESISFSKK